MEEKTSINYLTERLITALHGESEAKMQAGKIRRACLEVVSLYGPEAMQIFHQKINSFES